MPNFIKKIKEKLLQILPTSKSYNFVWNTIVPQPRDTFIDHPKNHVILHN